MGIFTFAARVHTLMYQKSNIEYRLLQITKKMQAFTQYAAIVGNGQVSIGDLLSAPGAMMGRTMNYLAYAHNTAMMAMMQQAPQAIAWQQQYWQGQSPEQQLQMQNFIKMKIYEQARDQAAQIENRNLKIENDKMAQEKERLDTLLKQVEQELKSARDARDAAIKDMAPKYVAQG